MVASWCRDDDSGLCARQHECTEQKCSKSHFALDGFALWPSGVTSLFSFLRLFSSRSRVTMTADHSCSYHSILHRAIIEDMLLRQSHRGSRQCFTIVNRIRDDSSTVLFRSVSAARLGRQVQQQRIYFSSESAYLSKVPDYLIPPAYRTRSPDDDRDGGKGRGRGGGNTERHGSRSGSAKRRSRSGGRPNHSNNKQTRKPSKHRRKPSGGNRRTLNRTKRDASMRNLD
eukprot:scaffold29174_cov67-Skeletonema_dohrnii-CCMP3373.AAC.1